MSVVKKENSNKTLSSSNFPIIDGDVEDDAFWSVAFLQDNETRERLHREGSDDDDDDGQRSSDDDLESNPSSSPIKRYTIPNSDGTVISVSPLPSKEGIWSPLGADAW